jgi:hypothetical protein
MIVTQRWCTSCEGDGALADVVKYGGEGEDGWPLHRAKADLEGFQRRQESDESYEPEYGDVLELSRTYECDRCGGSGFYFYVESLAPSQSCSDVVFLRDLPADAAICDISGPAEWVASQERAPVRRIERSHVR